MKTLQVVFTETEFKILLKAKHKLWNKDGKSMSWRQYLLQTARTIKNGN